MRAGWIGVECELGATWRIWFSLYLKSSSMASWIGRFQLKLWKNLIKRKKSVFKFTACQCVQENWIPNRYVKIYLHQSLCSTTYESQLPSICSFRREQLSSRTYTIFTTLMQTSEIPAIVINYHLTSPTLRHLNFIQCFLQEQSFGFWFSCPTIGVTDIWDTLKLLFQRSHVSCRILCCICRRPVIFWRNWRAACLFSLFILV